MKNKRLPKLKEHESALLQYADRFYIRRFPEKKKEEHELSSERLQKTTAERGASKKPRGKPVSLAGLSFEEAVAGLLATEPEHKSKGEHEI